MICLCQAGGVTFVTLTDTADSDMRHRMSAAAKSWKNPTLLSVSSSRCIGAADWLPAGENPLLHNHRVAVAREILLAIVDRVLTEVEEDEDFDDVQKVEMMRNYDRVDNYIAALKVLAI